MRPRSSVPAALAVLSLSLAGCAEGNGAGSGPTASGKPVASPSKAADEPQTPEEFLTRAREAMSGQKGWTFTVKGSEGLTSQGQESTATYTATVNRTQDPMALHSTGTTHAKGVAKPEEVYVVDATGYVRKGGPGAQWKSGSLTDPDIATVVEDPLAALDAFRSYGQEEPADGISVRKSTGQVALEVTVSSAKLPAVRSRGVVEKALRELTPTLEQLHTAGVAAPENGLTVERAEEELVLDPTTYRIKSHRFRCTFLIPYGGGSMRYSQEVTEQTQGAFTGVIALPSGVG
ncbi:hypothetical protein [Streptomyces sp. TRM68367]|uniref:hypothetical protein n=1 Tax=Streptomyces sp. TRM68367 TaxID=2758415 RepID=UPI00165C8344|nr:hypothetical protein [Streptomyces sp. TRM68367]MBC9727354.1 hypothetical protein [Streptomyces sp. TRM68367]